MSSAAPSIDDRILIGGMFAMAAEMQDPEFVVAPCFIRGQMLTMTARPGAGKSTLSSTLAMSFARNVPLGQLVPQSDGLAYYVSVEDFDGCAMRARAYRSKHRLAPSQCAEIDQRLRWLQVADVAPAFIAERIRKDCGDRGPIDLLFVDTGVALFRGESENDNSEIQGFGAECRKWFTTLPGKPCVIVLWHPVKGANADNLQPRGGSALTGTIDGNLTLWRDDDRMTLGFTKLRGPQFEPIDFALDPVTLELPSGRLWHVPIATALGDDTARQHDDASAKRREAILLALDDLAESESSSIRDLVPRLGLADVKRSRAAELLAEMARPPSALVAKGGIRGEYSITPAGRRAAKTVRKRLGAAQAGSAHRYRDATNGA